MVTTSMLSVTYLLRGGNHGLFEKMYFMELL